MNKVAFRNEYKDRSFLRQSPREHRNIPFVQEKDILPVQERPLVLAAGYTVLAMLWAAVYIWG